MSVEPAVVVADDDDLAGLIGGNDQADPELLNSSGRFEVCTLRRSAGLSGCGAFWVVITADVISNRSASGVERA